MYGTSHRYGARRASSSGRASFITTDGALANKWCDARYCGSLFNSLFAYHLLALAYGSLLLAAVLGKSIWQRVLSGAPLRFVELVSYSIYIWHWPLYQHVIVRLVGRFHSDALRALAFFALVVLVVIPVGYLSYQLTERPFIRFRMAAR